VRTFVIGDVHGHHDRLLELLNRAGIRQGDNTPIVQLGDLGQFSLDTREDDLRCWQVARAWGMTVLWGNHDRAVVDEVSHGFRGYSPPLSETIDVMREVAPKLCAVVGDYLLTHAGLHPVWGVGNHAVEAMLRIMNQYSHGDVAIVDSISRRRGGDGSCGGILWRDDGEPLDTSIPQVYGHTRGDIRRHGRSWCIDVASRENDSLAGLWLPEGRIVAVGPDAAYHEMPMPEDE